jgi:hypothetical protein
MLRLSAQAARRQCTFGSRCFGTSRWLLEDPRLHDLQRLGRVIEDEYAVLRNKYGIALGIMLH